MIPFKVASLECASSLKPSSTTNCVWLYYVSSLVYCRPIIFIVLWPDYWSFLQNEGKLKIFTYFYGALEDIFIFVKSFMKTLSFIKLLQSVLTECIMFLVYYTFLLPNNWCFYCPMTDVFIAQWLMFFKTSPILVVKSQVYCF